MACLHRPRGRDKTVLSRRVGGVNKPLVYTIPVMLNLGLGIGLKTEFFGLGLGLELCGLVKDQQTVM